MKPRAFYEISKENYLFRNKIKDINAPEEAVRQWALFELLSTYGTPIRNLEIEFNAGRKFSKFNPADIVVLQEQSLEEDKMIAYAVIECKEQNKKLNIKRGLKQAQDYAEYLRATFAILTNGKEWIVTRHWKDEWVSVNDIEKITEIASTKNVLDVIVTLEDFVPIFYWLHETVPSNEAVQYFSTLQHLFTSSDSRKLDHNLVLGTSALLATLGTFREIGQLSFKVEEYKNKKLKEAFFYLGTFYAHKGLDDKIKFLDVYDFGDLIRILLSDFSKLVENHDQMSLIDSSIIRLNFFLLKYLRDVYDSSSYTEIDVKTIGQEVETILEYILLKELNTVLPNSFEEDEIKAVKLYGKESWEKTKIAAIKK